MKAYLNIFPEEKKAFINRYDIINSHILPSIQLEYSTDIKELELQVLLHGYNILKRSTVVSDNSLFTDMIRYDLKHI